MNNALGLNEKIKLEKNCKIIKKIEEYTLMKFKSKIDLKLLRIAELMYLKFFK